MKKKAWEVGQQRKKLPSDITSILFFFVLLLMTCSHREERVKNARKYIQEWNYDRALTEIISYRGSKDGEIQYLLG